MSAPKRPADFRPEISAHGDPSPHEHAARWFAHVQAGRISTDPGTTPAQLLNHLRNEEVLLGQSPASSRSLRFATPAPYRKPR